MPNARCTGVPAMLQIADHLLGDVGEEGQQGQAEQGRNDLELVEGRGQRARQGDAQHDLGQHREVLAFTQRSRFMPKPIPTMTHSDNALARMVHTGKGPRSRLGRRRQDRRVHPGMACPPQPKAVRRLPAGMVAT